MERKLLIKIVVSFSVILIALLGLFVYLMITNKGTFSVKSMPEKVKVEVDKKTYDTPFEIELKPGKYSLKASKEGYLDYTTTVEIKKKVKTEITPSLVKKMDPKETEFLKKLPKETEFYKISYTYSGIEKVDYEIRLFAILNRASQIDSYNNQLAQYKKLSLDWITGQGMDPKKMNIKWIPKGAESL